MFELHNWYQSLIDQVDASTRYQTAIREVEEALTKKINDANDWVDQAIASLWDMIVALAEGEVPSTHGNNRGHAASGNSTNSSFSGRLAKIEFPKFNRENVKEWLYESFGVL